MDLVAVARHQAAAHALCLDDHPIDRAVSHPGARRIDERRNTRERSTAGQRHRAISAAVLAVTDLAIGLIDPLPAVQRLRRTRARVDEPIGRLSSERELCTVYRNRPRHRRNRPGVRLDVALVPHRREPTDFVHDGVGLAGAEEPERDEQQGSAFSHDALPPPRRRATTTRAARPYRLPWARRYRTGRS